MNYFFLSKTALFKGMTENEIGQLLPCLDYREVKYSKNEIILKAGKIIHEIGLVKSGSVNVVVNFYWGNSNIFAHIEKGDIFTESFALIPGKELICDVVASEPTEIIFFNLNKILKVCEKTCSFHHQLISNLLEISARKNLELTRRMMHTAPKSIRERLISYLSEQSTINGSSHFTIPYNRQQLADYLGVDRSSMSKELSKMQKDGLIEFKKNDFKLKEIR